jgi:hypothetical protein
MSNDPLLDRLRAIFARERPAVREITPDEFMGEHGLSMFFVARLSMLPEFPNELNSVSYFHATIDELGFGRSWLSRFSAEPPKDPRFGGWTTDRFFFAQSSKGRGNSLARVEIDEANVYDQQMRVELDYTGFRVSVTLNEETFRHLLEYVAARASWEEFRAPVFAVRMPSKPFVFPDRRGSPEYWLGGNSYTKNLRAIGRFKPDEFSVAIVECKTPYIKWSPGSTVYERYNVLSARKFSIVRP